MSEVVIFYPTAKSAAAQRLRDGIEGMGYSVALREIVDEDDFDPAETERPGAVLLIWSRPLVAAIAFAGHLPLLRRQRNVIEISADGVTPPSPAADENRVVLLSGWRGQPFHTGWKTIQSRLAGLLEAPIAPPARAAAAPPPGPRISTRRGAQRGKVMVAGAAAVLVIAAAALLGWWGLVSRAPLLHRRAAPVTTAAAAAVAPSRSHEARPAAAAERPPAPAPRPQAAGRQAAQVQQGLSRTSPDAAAGEKRVPHDHARAAPPADEAPGRRVRPHVATVHYSRQNSRTMRLFCQRAGQSTPECRTFRRAMSAH
jgi:hypothetical protein